MNCGLSVEEVHQIAYLTMKGWVLGSEYWTKDGFERAEERTHGCGCHHYEVKTPYFSLDEAYNTQLEQPDGDR
jgi:hypothetical protein